MLIKMFFVTASSLRSEGVGNFRDMFWKVDSMYVKKKEKTQTNSPTQKSR